MDFLETSFENVAQRRTTWTITIFKRSFNWNHEKYRRGSFRLKNEIFKKKSHYAKKTLKRTPEWPNEDSFKTMVPKGGTRGYFLVR